MSRVVDDMLSYFRLRTINLAPCCSVEDCFKLMPSSNAPAVSDTVGILQKKTFTTDKLQSDGACDMVKKCDDVHSRFHCATLRVKRRVTTRRPMSVRRSVTLVYCSSDFLCDIHQVPVRHGPIICLYGVLFQLMFLTATGSSLNSLYIRTCFLLLL